MHSVHVGSAITAHTLHVTTELRQ